jgi:hypothetical protein
MSADGLITAEANTLLDTFGTAFPWVQLHTGFPGAAGTANVAGNTVRKQATWNTAASATKTTSADLAWTSVSTSETYTHVTYWSASSGGTCGGSGPLTAPAVTAGDNFTITAGSLALAFTPAS